MNDFYILGAVMMVGKGIIYTVVSVEDSMEAAEKEAKRFERLRKPIIDHIEGQPSLF